MLLSGKIKSSDLDVTMIRELMNRSFDGYDNWLTFDEYCIDKISYASFLAMRVSVQWGKL